MRLLPVSTIMAPDRGLEMVNDTEMSKNSNTLIEEQKVAESAVLVSDDHTESTIPPHLSHDPDHNAKRTEPFQFGQRFLEKEDDVFAYNAWDHVKPDEEHEAYSETQYALQRAAPVSDFDRERFNSHPEKWWDIFYKQKTSTFFKDRKWLTQEFPVLAEVTRKDAGPKVVLEVGAGAGNTAFPLLRMNDNPALDLVAVDFSKNAVETMKNAEEYQDGKTRMRAAVWDAAGDILPEGISEGSVDVVIMIFIFSALNPKQWAQAVRNIWRLLKPGGEILFRDYGRGDLAQVRFKAGRWMEENFYVRGDGTRVYFFAKEELEQIWSGSYFESGTSREQPPRFDIVNLDVDRRLIVNRQRKLKMYRCWMQGRFKKPEE